LEKVTDYFHGHLKPGKEETKKSPERRVTLQKEGKRSQEQIREKEGKECSNAAQSKRVSELSIAAVWEERGSIAKRHKRKEEKTWVNWGEKKMENEQVGSLHLIPFITGLRESRLPSKRGHRSHEGVLGKRRAVCRRQLKRGGGENRIESSKQISEVTNAYKARIEKC